MGFGVFRRRPDYERRPRRLPLTVAAAAAVGPTLFVRQQAQEPPRYNYEIQRQARQSLPLPPPVSARAHRDLRAAPARIPAERYKYEVFHPRPKVALGVAAPAPGVQPALRLTPVLPPPPPLRFEPYRRIPVYPTVEPAPIPPGAQLVQHPRRPYFSSFVRPWDYLRGTGKWRRRIVEPDHPDLEPPPLPTRGWYDDIRGRYHSGKELPANEPWGRWRGDLNLSIPHGFWTQVDMTVEFSESGGGSSTDPWSLLRADGRISIKRSGYYVVSADIDFGPATSGGVRILSAAVRFRLFLADGTQQRVFLINREQLDASTGAQEVIFSAVSRPTPLIVGGALSCDVFITTDTAAARLLETNTFGLYRVHDTEPIGPTY